MNPIAVIAEFNFNPDKINTALTILENIIQRSRKESGCLLYELFQSDDQKNLYTMVERWESHEDWQTHMQSQHIVQAAQAIQSYLECPITVRSFTYVF